MVSARSLQPQDQIAHYRIVGPLGAGGMGEVYLAQDQTLERSVALKILPPELVRSEDRVRRFVREAKSASSLNHPNIVTIYEIGQDEIRASEGGAPKEPGSASVHFISMELVSGETLSTKIHHEKTDLRTLLGYLAQAAEGLAKAHSAGIVHRDLKPGNIMISKDGFAKVLDFGLAKLTEREDADPDVTSGATMPGDGTDVGAVVGTAGYMSPEQVRGASVDHRSDIFSFGCILYEAATRKKPFLAESNVETMHKILHDKPVPVEELNQGVPAEVRRLIRRCLAKNPDQRFQSAKDLAIELREIVDEYDSLSPSGASSGSGSSALAAADAGGRKRIPPAVLIAGAIVVGAVIVAGVMLARRGGESPTQTGAPPSLRITPITSRGAAGSAALSPDGRYLAYSMQMGGARTLWVRQVATGTDVQILPPQDVLPFGLTFTPDGNYLYYLGDDPEREGYKALFEIPSLGGTPRKRTYDVDSRVTFSPDGKRICFWRGVPHENRQDLVIFDLERGKDRILASAKPPLSFGPPSWSPDGKWIATIEARGGVTRGSSVVTYRVEDGKREAIGKNAWTQVDEVAWLPDGTGLVVVALDESTITIGQVWLLRYPSGQVSRITSDTNVYSSASLSADGASMAAVRFRQENDLWSTAPTDAGSVRQITFGSEGEGAFPSFDPAQDSTLVFGKVKDGSAQIFSVRADGSGERSLTADQGLAFSANFRPGVGIVYVRMGEDYIPHIWRMDANGDNPRQLTSGQGERINDVSEDGRQVLFQRDDMIDVLWRVPTAGGEPVRLGPSSSPSGTFSPDGSRIVHRRIYSADGQGVFSPQIISAEDGSPGATPALPPRVSDLRWTPDGTALTYLHASNERRNVFRADLSGGAPKEITRFSDGRIQSHRWSPDGRRLLVTRRTETTDNLWVTDADGGHPVAVTDFETGAITSAKWSRDGSRVYFTYGASNQNVVLIRNFR